MYLISIGVDDRNSNQSYCPDYHSYYSADYAHLVSFAKQATVLYKLYFMIVNSPGFVHLSARIPLTYVRTK